MPLARNRESHAFLRPFQRERLDHLFSLRYPCDVLVYFFKFLMGVIVMVHGGSQTVPYFLEVLVVFGDVLLELAHVSPDLLGAFLYLEGPQALEDRLQISQEGGRGHYDNLLFLKSILDQIPRIHLSHTHLVHQQVIINRFRRYEHESEIHRSHFGADIFRSLVYAVLQVLLEQLLESLPLPTIRGIQDPFIIFQRKLRIYGHYLVFDENDRVHDQILFGFFAFAQFILHLV